MNTTESKGHSVGGLSCGVANSCPKCGAYVSLGASDCARCGAMLVSPNTRHEKAHGEDLQNILIVMTVLTGMFLIVGMFSVWLEFGQDHSTQVVATIALITIFAIQFQGIWRMWRWERRGAIQYFAVTIIVLLYGWVWGEFGWSLVSETVFTLSFIYRVHQEWHHFE